MKSRRFKFQQLLGHPLVKAAPDFSRHSGKGNRLADYYCYAQPIVAAADGEVISLVNNIGPAPFVGYFVIDCLCRQMAGNHIVIKHADGEYGFYAHLIKGSIALTVGDNVKRGQTVGLCGHTGISSEPHLHFHLQDQPNFFRAMGLPVRFDQVDIGDRNAKGDAVLERGSRVRPS